MTSNHYHEGPPMVSWGGPEHSCTYLVGSSMSSRIFRSSAFVVLSLFGFGSMGVCQDVRHVIPEPGITKVKTLEQNWDEQAEQFYNIPQGSHLIPYQWFLHLELAESKALIRETENIQRLGYIARSPDDDNNDGLPIGFVKDVSFGAASKSYLGLTCAACHTGHVNFKGTTYLIDGAPTHGDFETFLRQLTASLSKTLASPEKFDRFASHVLEEPMSAEEKQRLRQELSGWLHARQSYNDRNLPAEGAPAFGHGRVDAFGAILNEVAVRFAEVPGNHAPANAPVSYPVLWDAPQHDFVQWNGAAENKKNRLLKVLVGTEHIGALGRNTGEVLGVFGEVHASTEPSIRELRHYPNSANRNHLIAIEDWLQSLWSPQWPEEFPPIDEDLRAKGHVLFKAHCAKCHKSINRTDAARKVTAGMSDEGTDSLMAQNFYTRRAKTGVLKGRRVEPLSKKSDVFGDEAPVAQMLKHLVQRSIIRSSDEIIAKGEAHVTKLLRRLNSSVDFQLSGRIIDHKESVGDGGGNAGRAGRFKFGSRGISRHVRNVLGETIKRRESRLEEPVTDEARVSFDYKARPLNGIWASAPYLHNGSVPNLDELLKRPEERSKEVFKVGSAEFDSVKVGFHSDEGDDFNPTLPGNLNSGHDYGHENGSSFTAQERRELIEYLKSL